MKFGDVETKITRKVFIVEVLKVWWRCIIPIGGTAQNALRHAVMIMRHGFHGEGSPRKNKVS